MSSGMKPASSRKSRDVNAVGLDAEPWPMPEAPPAGRTGGCAPQSGRAGAAADDRRVRAPGRRSRGRPQSGMRRGDAGSRRLASASGAATGISCSASSIVKSCSSRIAASLQRPGPIELGHHRRPALDADPVDAVLVAVQRQQPAVAVQADALHRRQDVVRREFLVGEACGGFRGCIATHGGFVLHPVV